MDQTKVGAFIKELRREHNLTQEQMADRFGVSRRTVSRWENGRNLPELDLLIELSDAFGVDLRELLEGQRKPERLNPELAQTARQLAEYSMEEKTQMTLWLHVVLWSGLLGSIVYLVLLFTDRIYGVQGSFLAGGCQGIGIGSLVAGILMTSRYGARIRAAKMRFKQQVKDKFFQKR